MLKVAANVCVIILVIASFCEKCYSLEIYYEHEVNNDLDNDADLIAPEAINNVGIYYKEPVTEISKQPENYLLKLLFGDKLYQVENDIETNQIDEENGKYGLEDVETAVRSRVVRQAYPGQAPLYPKLPSSSPYNQYQPYPNYNNQNPQWQPPNNYSQQSYPTNGGSSFYPSSQHNSTYGQQPYNPSQGQNPYNNLPSPSYPGYRPPNTTVYNSGLSRPPYNPYGQFNNNSYPSYPTKTPGYRPSSTVTPYNPSQRPPYYSTTPNNRYPVMYNYTTNRPSYNNHNTSYWSNSSGPNAPPYNAPNGQNPQYPNSHPYNPYKPPNSTSPYNLPNQGPYHTPSNGYPTYNNSNSGQYYGQNPQSFNSNPQGPYQNPYNNPSNSQYAGSNNYPGNSYGLDNPANGYNPSIPSRPPYSSGPGQSNVRYPPGNNGITHDPTKVSPEYFSYPH